MARRTSDKQQIAEAFHVNGPSIDSLLLAPNDDIRPTTFQPIIRADEDGTPMTFNARAKGIEKAPMWGHSLEAKRCLKDSGTKQENNLNKARVVRAYFGTSSSIAWSRT